MIFIMDPHVFASLNVYIFGPLNLVSFEVSIAYPVLFIHNFILLVWKNF
jgi:hypothetical protein